MALPSCVVLLQSLVCIVADFSQGCYFPGYGTAYAETSGGEEIIMAERAEKVIKITGAAEHNLKNINLSIPRDKLVVITGISGSGKSSLAFDTIYAEGRRKYVESLSAYARQFLEQMQKPAVADITGLP
ncbi:MAG: hypothetical protein MUP16_04190, partial [Sedimentisphaerales bacterium]|nr:hypothetical protein [Sedimentisphaerales bacterium]